MAIKSDSTLVVSPGGTKAPHYWIADGVISLRKLNKPTHSLDKKKMQQKY